MENINHKNLDALDLLKFIMAIMVVAIHTRLFEDVTFPWLRLAVPIFFIISSFFFFFKIKDKDSRFCRQALLKFTKRNMQLYFFYLILLLPITLLSMKEIFSYGVIGAILKFLSAFVFGNTFRASWFITALVIDTAIVFFLSRRLSNLGIFLICAVIYTIVTLYSSYYSLFSDFKGIAAFCEWYDETFDVIYNSFPAGLIWVSIGKCFADGNIKLKNNKLNCILLVPFAALLFLEWYIVKFTLSEDGCNDCFFTLVPICPIVFAIFKNMNIHIRFSLLLRNLSTMIYTLHASVIFVLRELFLRKYDLIHSVLEFVLTLTITLLLCTLLLLLEKRTKLKVLKYSH